MPVVLAISEVCAYVFVEIDPYKMLILPEFNRVDMNFAVGILDGKFQTEVFFRRYTDLRLSNDEHSIFSGIKLTNSILTGKFPREASMELEWSSYPFCEHSVNHEVVVLFGLQVLCEVALDHCRWVVQLTAENWYSPKHDVNMVWRISLLAHRPLGEAASAFL